MRWKGLLHDKLYVLQETSSKQQMLALLQGWRNQVLQTHDAAALSLERCLAAWAATAQKMALLRFLLMEHTLVQQVGSAKL